MSLFHCDLRTKRVHETHLSGSIAWLVMFAFVWALRGKDGVRLLPPALPVNVDLSLPPLPLLKSGEDNLT
jgi:hypothetical protein